MSAVPHNRARRDRVVQLPRHEPAPADRIAVSMATDRATAAEPVRREPAMAGELPTVGPLAAIPAEPELLQRPELRYMRGAATEVVRHQMGGHGVRHGRRSSTSERCRHGASEQLRLHSTANAR